VDRLQPRRRAWAAQDPNLQGGFCSSIGSCDVAWCGVQDLMPFCLCAALFAVVLKQTLFVQVYVDGSTTMSTHERKASIREFYGKCPATTTGRGTKKNIFVKLQLKKTHTPVCNLVL